MAIEVDAKVISSIRGKLNKLIQLDPNSYDNRDLDLISEDWYLSSFVVNTKRTVDNVVEKVDKCLKWRKLIKIRDLKVTDFPQVFYRQKIYECYKVGQTYYVLFNYRHIHIPSGFADVYYKFSAIWGEVNMYTRKQGLNLVYIHDATNMTMSNVNMTFFMKFSELSSYYPMATKNYIVGLNWLFKQIMSVVIMATDEQFKSVLEFVDSNQLLDKLGQDATPTIHGGKVDPNMQSPDDLERCVDLAECTMIHRISDKDASIAVNFYSKLGLQV